MTNSNPRDTGPGPVSPFCQPLSAATDDASTARFGLWFLSATVLGTLLLAIAIGLADPRPWALAALLVFLPVLFNMVYMLGLHSTYLRARHPPRTAHPPEHWPHVAVIIPSRNEPYDVARLTFDSAAALDYPGRLSLIVVDNSDAGHPDLARWQAHVQAHGEHPDTPHQVLFLHRDGVQGYKPRNLDIGVAASDAEWVLFLDVDSSVPRDLLQHAAALSGDPELGFVQFESHPVNAHFNSLTESLGVVQQIDRAILGLRFGGAFPVFYGHNGLWRKETLLSIGGWEESSRFPRRPWHWPAWLLGRLGPAQAVDETLVTEDMAASFRALKLGWKAAHVWLPTGEWVPASWRELEAQWFRWSVGTLQIGARYAGEALRSTRLSGLQKIDFLQHVMFYISRGLAPLFVIGGALSGSPLLALLLLMGVAIGCPAWVGWWRNNPQQGRRVPRILRAAIPLGALISLIVARGLLRFLRRKPQGWKPTGKARHAHPGLLAGLRQTGAAWVFLAMTAAALATGYALGNNPWYMLPHLMFSLALLWAVIAFATCEREAKDLADSARIDRGS